jgi:hypothetical protein
VTSWLLALTAAALLVAGCGGAPDATRTALAVTAGAVAGADVVSADVYEATADRCLAESETAGDYAACRRKVDALEVGLRSAHRSLLVSQAALDAWDDGDEGGSFLRAAPCLLASLAHLAALLEGVGIDLPPELGRAISLVGAFGGTCGGES